MGAREILESTYHGVADIYHYPQMERDGITEGKRTMLYEGVRCALSKSSLNKSMMTGGSNRIAYDAVLFCSPELDIPAGCEMEISQDGMQHCYKNTGEGFKYPSHQEILLERAEYA